MGRAKQLLAHGGSTLVRHAAEVAVACRCGPVAVVVGASSDAVAAERVGLPVAVVRNPGWEHGIGSSIRAGVGFFAEDANVDAVVILLADQPRVGYEVVGRLIRAHRETGSPVVAATYAGTVGVPALFARSRFAELLALDDWAGAKRIIERAGAEAIRVAVPEAEFDIDTPADYERLRGEGGPAGD